MITNKTTNQKSRQNFGANQKTNEKNEKNKIFYLKTSGGKLQSDKSNVFKAVADDMNSLIDVCILISFDDLRAEKTQPESFKVVSEFEHGFNEAQS